MISSSAFISEYVRLTGTSINRAVKVGKALRDARLVTKEGRGVSAAKMGPKDCANLLLGLLIPGENIAEAVKEFSSLPLTFHLPLFEDLIKALSGKSRDELKAKRDEIKAKGNEILNNFPIKNLRGALEAVFSETTYTAISRINLRVERRQVQIYWNDSKGIEMKLFFGNQNDQEEHRLLSTDIHLNGKAVRALIQLVNPSLPIIYPKWEKHEVLIEQLREMRDHIAEEIKISPLKGESKGGDKEHGISNG